MPEKQKTRNWKETYTVLAAFAMTLLLTLWNAFANQDRNKLQDVDPSLGTPVHVDASEDNCASPSSLAPNVGARCNIVTSTRSS